MDGWMDISGHRVLHEFMDDGCVTDSITDMIATINCRLPCKY